MTRVIGKKLLQDSQVHQANIELWLSGESLDELLFPICVAQVFARVHHVTDKLFDLFYFGKAIEVFAIKNFFIVDKYLVHTPCFAGLQCY